HLIQRFSGTSRRCRNERILGRTTFDIQFMGWRECSRSEPRPEGRYSAATRRAERTPSASEATRSVTDLIVFAVARASASRLCRIASTSAEPTTTASEAAAIARASLAVLTPKPTAIGSLV